MVCQHAVCNLPRTCLRNQGVVRSVTTDTPSSARHRDSLCVWFAISFWFRNFSLWSDFSLLTYSTEGPHHFKKLECMYLCRELNCACHDTYIIQDVPRHTHYSSFPLRFLKRGPRLANGLQASKCGLLKWQLCMSGREEKESGWHSRVRAGESDPTKKNGVDLMCDYTWQIMVTV